MANKRALKTACLILFSLIILSSLVSQVSAMIFLKLMPPSPYTVYVNQTYTLRIGVQYQIPPEAEKLYGPYVVWVESPPYRSGVVTLHGSGVIAIPLTLKAPSEPGAYVLGLKLMVQPKGYSPSIADTATVNYYVIQPVVTDWDVTKVWITPSSPGPGDEVTFYATIALKSTTSTSPLTVGVACLLDKKLFEYGTLTFNPAPYSQNIATLKKWVATEGSHVVTFVVDPERQHNDPTPYPTYNHGSYSFTVEPYYAIILKITATPDRVRQGEQFRVTVTVEYKFPNPTTLQIIHVNNATQPPADDETFDTVSGSGTKDYVFQATAPTTEVCGATRIQGSGAVQFDRGDGKGWQRSRPWLSYYNVTILAPEWYVEITSFEAEYAGEPKPGYGRISMTINLRYYLPKEAMLRITVMQGPNRTVVWRDLSTIRQSKPAEREAAYTHTYEFPLIAATDGYGSFYATVDYYACGSWHSGSQSSTQASGIPVSTFTRRAPERAPVSAGDYIIAALQKILEWFKKLFPFETKILWL